MAGEKIFTTWLTGSDGADHAVTDEEFHDNRPEPGTVCGEVMLLAPMEAPPGPRCPQCVAFLAARESMGDLDARHRRWTRLIPHWYRGGVAMTLRLSDEENRQLDEIGRAHV